MLRALFLSVGELPVSTCLDSLKSDVHQANLDLVSQGLVILTWGNVSGIDRDTGIVAIKPSGVPYKELRPEDIVLVDLAGNALEQGLRPSSDLATHLELYRHFPEIGGVAHTHSHFATAFAQASREIPCFGTTHADHFYGAIPVTRDLRPGEMSDAYERNTGKVITELFASDSAGAMPGALVAHHGPFTWGTTPQDAVINSVVLEEVARLAQDTVVLSSAVAPISQALLDRHFLRKHGPEAYYGQG
ncbi:MAG: L-ribulose-5-phosphate 4-epimerase AraD [Lentisphaerae bacterium]|jgi:L-ribulose-5-phosphate 4-epimerase|nr:L-ribulose-5-phosphate 4-epimerase AraD [Lentisphaerota bacterium]MBT4815925.1 L-ribulose-5-phosphate 4-epimerase AraD [Lentisphaerota bacterium]MBT5611601.1 L-ribulose-5-phosphate 4-epimerase AraD [Lentisphaerota bacterium]MBT7061700.1 L-ribulose-5-phosphate 4-epimerase AraD [Lentisphaerota bacterium]MBT7846546.1 L-ribulose-5-phosphate 4-epimerase AraD [Lentisphaerota bacterium]